MVIECETIDTDTSFMTEGNLASITVVWLDATTNEHPKMIAIQQALLLVIKHLEKFSDIEKCKYYIQHVSKKDNIILIANESMGKEIVPFIHDLRQVLSIYIFCVDNDKWSREFTKVQGMFIELNDLINKIKFNYQKQNNELLMNIFNINQNSNHSKSSYRHIFIDCLLRLKSTSTDKHKFMFQSLQKSKDKSQTKSIRKFQKHYTPEKACFWYTNGSFLSEELNKALYVFNIDMLLYLRFFIRDIREQLESHRYTMPIRVYHAQMITAKEVHQLENSVGGFISMNSFLSASRDPEVALFSLGDDTTNHDDLQRVLFEIDADPRLDGVKAFADISSFNQTNNEREILFMLGSVFRLIEIRREETGLYIIHMILCSDDERDFKICIDQTKEHYNIGETSLLSIGQILHQMGRLNDAIKYYRRLLNELPYDDDEIALCYHNLGRVYAAKKEYDWSLRWYDKALETMRKTLDKNDIRIAATHNSVGNVFRKNGNHDQALESYHIALNIWGKTFGDDSLKLATCLINMGVTYDAKEDYIEALECLEKALEIMKKCRPGNNRDLAGLYNNIGLVYDSLGNFSSALSHYQHAYDTYQKSFYPKNVDVASTLENIGRLYENHNQREKAVKYLKAALNKYRLNLSSSDPRIVQIEKDLEHFCFTIKIVEKLSLIELDIFLF